MDDINTNKISDVVEGSLEGERRKEGGTGASKERMPKRLKLLIDAGETAIKRSTQSAPTTPTNIAVLDLTWDDNEARSIKRKKLEGEAREEDPFKWYDKGNTRQSLGKKIRTVITSIEREVRVVAQMAREKNTKKEIKEAASNLSSLVSQITTAEARELLQKLGRPTEIGAGPRDDGEAKATQTDECEKDKRIRELERQLENARRERKKLVQEIEDLKPTKTVTEKQVDKVKDYVEYTAISKYTWPTGVFRAAFNAEGSPLKANKETDLVCLVDNTEEGRIQGLRKIYEERYPELKEMAGRVSALKLQMSLEKDGKMCTSERFIYRVEVGNTEEEWYEALSLIKDNMKNAKREKVAVYSPKEDSDGANTRKMAEVIFRGTGMKCLIYSEPGLKRQGEYNKKANRDTEAILVSQDGRSYAELLKTVKETVKAGTTAARGIRTIREGKDGRMIIVTEEKEKEAVDRLKKELREGGNMTTKDIGRQKGIIYIKDMDALVEKAEVEDAVGRETGLDKTRLEVGDLRPYFGGNQTVTIRLPKERAEDLIRKGDIRIGLNRCKVVGRVEVLQCYKCWSYGHIREKCTENTDMRTACRKCGKEGHAAKECTNKEYCHSCKTENHRMGTSKFSEFKAALSKARSEAAQKKSLNGKLL